VQYIAPTASEHRHRLGVVDRITGVVNKLWEGAKVYVFGSFTTGLYLPTRYA